jgi:hypothetical protein
MDPIACSLRLAIARKGLSRLVLSLSKSGAGIGQIGEDADLGSRVICRPVEISKP